MPRFNEDVVINGHNLILKTGNGKTVASINQDGNLVMNREISGAIVQVLQFASGEVFGAPVTVLTIGANTAPGTVSVGGGGSSQAIALTGGDAAIRVGRQGNGGEIIVSDLRGREVFIMNSSEASLTIGASAGGSSASASSPGGDIIVRDSNGLQTFNMNGDSATLTIGTSGAEGNVIVRDGNGLQAFNMNGDSATLTVGASGVEGDIIVRDSNGANSIHLDGKTGDISLKGADLAEEFDTSVPVAPGSVLVAIGADEVAPAAVAHDRSVVGVASGAGDLQPALRLGARPGEHRVPVALVGRVHCKVDADYGSIAIGDLLTTSPTVGHAMRVDDPARALGAIIGKALSPLTCGTGIIPVLLIHQ
ncbi:hypothetical protein [Nocardia salmonicida]|uniref:hypothetical protein n=1 Tax=Nocardia salmonicida TaxID=53431 RepID=UPI00363380F1